MIKKQIRNHGLKTFKKILMEKNKFNNKNGKT